MIEAGSPTEEVLLLEGKGCILIKMERGKVLAATDWKLGMKERKSLFRDLYPGLEIEDLKVEEIACYVIPHTRGPAIGTEKSSPRKSNVLHVVVITIKQSVWGNGL